jgi:hypothetical protein
MAVGLTQSLTEMGTSECFWGVQRGRRVRLTTSLQSVSLLSRQCRILNISKTFRFPQPVTRLAITKYVALGRERTIPTERSPLEGEVSANIFR